MDEKPSALRDAMTQVGVTPEELAAACGVTRQAVHTWLTGQSIPRGDRAKKALDYLEAKAKDKRIPVRDRLTLEALVSR